MSDRPWDVSDCCRRCCGLTKVAEGPESSTREAQSCETSRHTNAPWSICREASSSPSSTSPAFARSAMATCPAEAGESDSVWKAGSAAHEQISLHRAIQQRTWRSCTLTVMSSCCRTSLLFSVGPVYGLRAGCCPPGASARSTWPSRAPLFVPLAFKRLQSRAEERPPGSRRHLLAAVTGLLAGTRLNCGVILRQVALARHLVPRSGELSCMTRKRKAQAANQWTVSEGQQ